MAAGQYGTDDSTGQSGFYGSDQSYQPEPQSYPRYDVGQPYPQSAPPYPMPPYPMPTTGLPYPYPGSAPPGAGQPYPTSGPPPGAPPPRKKGRQVVWFASGIIAAMVIATLLIGGVVIGQGNSKGKPSAAASASASPARVYKFPEESCTLLELRQMHALAPVLQESGEPTSRTLEGYTSIRCDGIFLKTPNDEGRAIIATEARYYQDPKLAQEGFAEHRSDCKKPPGGGAGDTVPGLGQKACITQSEDSSGEMVIAETSLHIWDGNIVVILQVLHAKSLREKKSKVAEAIIRDAKTFLAELAKV